MSPQSIGWFLTACGILTSLGWNWHNRRRTDQTAERLRQESYRDNQWSRIRGRIETALDELVDTSKIIVRQVQQLKEGDPIDVTINLVSQMIIDTQDALASALEEASESVYCEGNHWTEAAHGKTAGTETSWDNILSILDEAGSAIGKDDKVDVLRKIKKPIGEIQAMVRECCRVQDIDLDPTPKK